MDRIARVVAGAPLGEVQRQVRKFRRRDLLAHPADVADDGIGVGRQLVVVLPLLIEETTIDAVGVRRDEIDWDVSASHEVEQLGNPSRSGGRWPADSELRVDRLDRPGAVFVEVEIGLLVGLFPEAVEVGLVPHLEIPAAHLGLAVALAQVPDEGVDQRAPAGPVGMRGVALPVEDLAVRRLQRLRA